MQITISKLRKEKEIEDVWTLKDNSFINIIYKVTTSLKEDNDDKSKLDKEDINKKYENNNTNNNEFIVDNNMKDKIKYNYKKNKSDLSEKNIDLKMNDFIASTLETQYEKKEKLSSNNLFHSKSSTGNKNYEILESNIKINDPNDIYSSEYISKLNYSEIEYDTFCHCFFISGLTYNNTELIPESEEYPSTCLHSECSILSSFQPNIIQYYQNKNKKCQIDISNLTANLVFPLGIKICFNDLNNNNYPKPYNSFLNVIRNEKGEIYYIVSLHYFRKIEISEFDKKYKINPLKEYTKFQNLHDEDENFDIEKFKRNLDIVTKFIGNETILIPECITLVSRFPFINQMNECLKTMIKLNEKELNDLINHLTNEIPVPYKNQKILFYIPYNTSIIQLISPFKPSMINCTTCNILKHLSIENIIKIYHFILLEQKILFIDNDYQLLSNISFAFINLIYPFFWSNIYVPVLSLSTVRFLQSIIPFIMGTDEFLFKYSLNNDYINKKNDNHIIFVDIKNDEITINVEQILKKKFLWKKDIIKEFKLPKFPEDIEKFLNKQLTNIKKINNNYIVEEKIRDIFLTAFIMMFGHIHVYSFMREKENPVFNSEYFLMSKKNDKKFYKEILQTQNFNQFLFNENEIIQNKKKPLYEPYGKIYDNLIVDTSSFNKKAKKYIQENDNIIMYNKKKIRANSSKKNTLKIMKSKTQILNNQQEFNQKENNESFTNMKYNLAKRSFYENSMTKKSENLNSISNLISPYFINIPIISLDREKIEIYIENEINKKESLKSEEEKNLPEYIILNSKKNYNVNDVKDIYRRYFINISQNSFIIKKKSLSESNLLNLNNIQDKQSIKDWFNIICSIEFENENKEILEITNLMKKDINREYFCNLIFQGSTQNNIFKKGLSNKSYHELLKVIYYTLNYLTETENKTGKLLTLICFSYFTFENRTKKIKYIYEDYVKNFKSCKLWEIKNFWYEWFMDDLMYEDNSLSNESEDYNNYNIISANKILINLYIIMCNLKLNYNFINDVIINQLAKNNLSNEEIEELNNEIKIYDEENNLEKNIYILENLI